MIQLRYFASLRDRLGTDAERLALPAGVITVAELRRHLQGRGGVWAEVFADSEPVLAAVNQEMAAPETALADGDEVGFFPPVTGG